MPNHVQNRLKIFGNSEQIRVVLDSTKSVGEDGNDIQMDFNKIVSMPEELNIESGSVGETGLSVMFDMPVSKRFYLGREFYTESFIKMDRERQKRVIEDGFKYYDNIIKYGHATWYEWAVENWGTKWNAYNQPDKRNTKDTIHFQTAWASPVGLMQKLSEKFPGVKMKLTYADEDSGSNTGIITFLEDGSVFAITPESQSKEGYEIYFELHPGRKDDYIFQDGQYSYKEE